MTKNKIDDLTEVLLEDINGVKHSYTLSKLGYKRYTSCPIVNLANYFLNNFPSSNFEIGLRKNDCVFHLKKYPKALLTMKELLVQI